MSQQYEGRYEFEADLPLKGIAPGTNVLVAGPTMGGARDLALRLVTGANALDDEGMLLISTNRAGKKLLSDCDRLCANLDRGRLGVIDCVSEQHGGGEFPNEVETVSNPGDLTGIGIEFSGLYENFHSESVSRIRAGLFSVSTLLMYTDVQTVSRFIHTLGGRIAATAGLGVFLIDPTTQDDRVVNTIAQFCDGRIDVREADGASELRVRGLGGQSNGWTEF